MAQSDTMDAVERQPRRRVERSSTVLTPTAFASLYQAEFAPMVRLAVLLTGNQQVAADIAQDAFVKLHVKWAGVREPAAYLRTSVVNGARSYHRRRIRRREVPLTEQLEHRHGETDGAGGGRSFDHTLSTLDVLSARERACIVLKFYAGLPEREIASTIRCRPGSVGPTVQRALQKLRSQQ